jgi:hypothetical protein
MFFFKHFPPDKLIVKPVSLGPIALRSFGLALQVNLLLILRLIFSSPYQRVLQAKALHTPALQFP